LIDRGDKQRKDLFFLNNTDQPAILIEVCFVDSAADVDHYQDNLLAICQAIADTLENA
jgi:N-acetylmuramoyl-L-alanine amidase